MKYVFFILLTLLTACAPRERAEHLPWQTSISDSGATKVFGIAIGDVTLKGLSIHLKKIADNALFETAKGDLSLESYFGKTTIGLLEARIIADIDASDEFLKTEKAHAKDRDSTPNNNWKYKLSTEGAAEIVDMKIWRLVYIPTAEYDKKQIDFFGEPKQTLKITKTAEYRLFPDKGIAILWDSKGGEIFYYVAPKDFARLQNSLPMKVVRPKED